MSRAAALRAFRIPIFPTTRPSKVSASEDCSCAVATSAAAVGANLANADATTILAARTIIVKSSVMAHQLLVLICAQPWTSLAVRKIGRWPAGTIKLPFRKLNSMLFARFKSDCSRDGAYGPGQVGSMRRECDLRRATRPGRNREAEAVQFDDRRDHTQAQAEAFDVSTFV
jgi:hypothetical protein